MRGMLNHFGQTGLALGVVLWLLAGAGTALAAENELRLPVEKSVRLAPPPEAPRATPAEAAKPAEAVKPEKKAEPAPAGPKAEAPKAELPKAKPELKPEPKIDAKKPEAPKAEKKPDAAKAETAPAPKAVAKAKSKAPEAAPEPAPKPKPEPKVDPLALLFPAQPQPHETTVLPEGGQFVGDVELEFLADRLILRAATSAPVERVTHFGLTAPSGPRKLALDLRGPWRRKGGGVLRFDTGPVKAVVTGEHPDRLRLAVEFREGAVAPDMQPTVELGPKGCTVTIPLAVRLKR
ncbi:MAG: hypothetical protein Q7U56_04445 [Humidesulfovibrio sp.]|nr:hypothetical protein [Humidesulfovibrio sp.]